MVKICLVKTYQWTKNYSYQNLKCLYLVSGLLTNASGLQTGKGIAQLFNAFLLKKLFKILTLFYTSGLGIVV